MAALEPEVDLVTFLDANTTLTAGNDLFEFAPVPPDREAGMPVQAVFVFPAGGPPPEMHLEPTTTDLFRHAIQIRIRSPQTDFATGIDTAREVLAAAHRAVITNYIWVNALQSQPTYLGPDDRGSHEWVVNVEMAAEE